MKKEIIKKKIKVTVSPDETPLAINLLGLSTGREDMDAIVAKLNEVINYINEHK